MDLRLETPRRSIDGISRVMPGETIVDANWGGAFTLVLDGGRAGKGEDQKGKYDIGGFVSKARAGVEISYRG